MDAEDNESSGAEWPKTEDAQNRKRMAAEEKNNPDNVMPQGQQSHTECPKPAKAHNIYWLPKYC